MILILSATNKALASQFVGVINFPAVANQTFSTNPVRITLPISSTGETVHTTVLGPASLTGNLLTLNGTGKVSLVAEVSASLKNGYQIADYAVTTLAGNGRDGNDDGVSTNATFSNIHQIVADHSGNIFVNQYTSAYGSNNCIRRIDSNGVVSTLEKPVFNIEDYNVFMTNGPFSITVDKNNEGEILLWTKFL